MTAASDGAAVLLARALGRPAVRIQRATPLGGGSISDVTRFDTDAGVFVMKSQRRAPADFFQAEADGLAALAASGTTLVIPRVIAVVAGDPGAIVLEHLERGPRGASFDDALGRGLAELHRATSERFGFHAGNYCGLTPQPNRWTTSWIDFYRDARIGHMQRLASRAGLLSAADNALLDRLRARLGTLIDEPGTGPSLIHGDLWSGNLTSTAAGKPALIDPAVSYSHREAELGMMTLFGGFPARVFDAYDEAFPLAPGWRARNPIYELYHLMNHLNLFGAGYHAEVMAIVRRHA
jgi:fructosamine-3-kinase